MYMWRHCNYIFRRSLTAFPSHFPCHTVSHTPSFVKSGQNAAVCPSSGLRQWLRDSLGDPVSAVIVLLSYTAKWTQGNPCVCVPAAFIEAATTQKTESIFSRKSYLYHDHFRIAIRSHANFCENRPRKELFQDHLKPWRSSRAASFPTHSLNHYTIIFSVQKYTRIPYLVTIGLEAAACVALKHQCRFKLYIKRFIHETRVDWIAVT